MTTPEPFKTYYDRRVDSLVELYANIAEQAFGSFLDEAIDPAALVGYSAGDDPYGLMEQYERRRAAGIKTIVFAAMAIEAAAFEFAAIALGDPLAEDLDKMTLAGKWIVATRLAFGQSLNPDGPAINHLRGLVGARNRLVHHKSKPDDSDGKSVQAMMKRWIDFERLKVPEAFGTLVLLSLELQALPEGVYDLLPFYQQHDFFDCPRHPGVKKAIDRCHEIHRNSLKGV